MKHETETEVRSENTSAITAYAIGAVKENEMKIFEIITLRVDWYFSPSEAPYLLLKSTVAVVSNLHILLCLH